MSESSVLPPPPPPAQAPLPPPVPPSSYPPPDYVPVLPERPRRSGGRTALLVIAIVLAVIAAGVIVVRSANDSTDGAGGDGRPENVVGTLARACRGNGVQGAGAYQGAGPFHLVVVGNDGRHIPWSDRAARWRADEVADTELVACIQRQSTLIETCPYIGGSDINRYRTDVTVRVVTARTARPVTSFSLSADPRQCQATEYVSTVRLDGEVPFNQVGQRLSQLAHQPA